MTNLQHAHSQLPKFCISCARLWSIAESQFSTMYQTKWVDLMQMVWSPYFAIYNDIPWTWIYCIAVCTSWRRVALRPVHLY